MPATASTVRYAEDVVGRYTLYKRSVPLSRTRWFVSYLPGQNEQGYGSKITTEVVLRFNGCGRTYRVYATCYSNCASHWITRQGERLHLRHFSQDDIMMEPAK